MGMMGGMGMGMGRNLRVKAPSLSESYSYNPSLSNVDWKNFDLEQVMPSFLPSVRFMVLTLGTSFAKPMRMLLGLKGLQSAESYPTLTQRESRCP